MIPRRAAARGPRLPRRLRAAAAVALAAGALASVAAESATQGQEPPPGPDEPPPSESLADPGPSRLPSPHAPADPEAPGFPASDDPELIDLGRQLYVDGCSSCHGFELRGIEDRGPSLRGVGEASADFYLRTGRMPLEDPEDQPVRQEALYTGEEQRAIVEYIGRFGGPTIPEVHPDQGDIGAGFRLFTENCAGCHQIVAQGGVSKDAVLPPLQESSPVEIAEAIEVGPYVMPKFSGLTRSDVNSIAAYVTYTRNPDDEGGWGIGNLGPIPEGMVAWLLAGATLLLVIRLIGERTTE